MKREELEQLIVSLIDGDINPEEQQQLEQWMDAHPDDRTLCEEMQKTYALLGHLNKNDVPVIPLQAADYAQREVVKKKRFRWTLAAAACLALFLFCVSQGVVVQVGEMRVAVGAVPTSHDMGQEMKELIASEELLARRQNELERSIEILTALREADSKLYQQKMEQFSIELIKELNRKLGQYYVMDYPQ